jgi:hypothetical protein
MGPEKPTASREERRSPSRHTGLPSVHLYQSDRVKPVSTRLPRLVARGCPDAVLGHLVRDTCLRRIHPDDKPFVLGPAGRLPGAFSCRRRGWGTSGDEVGSSSRIASAAGKVATQSDLCSGWINQCRLQNDLELVRYAAGLAVGVLDVTQVVYVRVCRTRAVGRVVREIHRHSTQGAAMGQHMSNLHTLGKLGIRSG